MTRSAPRQRITLPPASVQVRQRGLAAFLIGALSLLAVPSAHDPRKALLVLAVVVVFGGAAIWLGMTANRQARREGTARPGWAFGGVLLGVFGAGFGVLMLSAFAMFWPQLNTYFSCMNSANTITAQQTCATQFKQATGQQIGIP
jgi:uncharacterized membrane protein YfcA